MSDKEQKKEENSAVNEKNGELLRWVTFKLGNEIYGVNVMQVREVLRYTDIAPVPGAPSYVLGIINLRGNVVTVIDTRARFGIPPAEVTDNTRIMIIESEKHVIGILVDSVAEVADLNTADPLIPTSFSSALRQLFWHPVTPNLNLCGSSLAKYLSSNFLAIS